METSRRVSTQTINVQEDNFSKSNNILQNQRSPQKKSRAKKNSKEVSSLVVLNSTQENHLMLSIDRYLFVVLLYSTNSIPSHPHPHPQDSTKMTQKVFTWIFA
jgi:hypothetical protein